MSYYRESIRTLEAKEVNEYLIEHIEGEKNICHFFSCGRELSLMESLYGNLCPFHQCEEKTIDVVDKYISL